MSRVGKMPIVLPSGVEVAIAEAKITVKGSMGTLSMPLNGLVNIKNNGGTLVFEAANDSREANAMSGTLRHWSITWSMASPRASKRNSIWLAWATKPKRKAKNLICLSASHIRSCTKCQQA